MAKTVSAPNIDLEGLKTQLQGLKTRAEALTTKKEGLMREATIQEQNQQRATQELKDLGFPDAEILDLEGLTKLAGNLTVDLTAALGELEQAVASTETLLGVAQQTAMDLD